MADRDSELKLKYTIDPQAQKTALKSVVDLRSRLKDLTAEIKRTDVTSSGLSNSLGKFSQKAVAQTNEILKGTRALRDQVSVLDTYKRKLAEAQSAGQGGGSTPSFGRLGSTTTAIGGILSSAGLGDLGGVTSQVGRVTNVLQQLQAVSGSSVGPISAVVGSVGSMAIAAPLAGVAVIALSLAVKKFTDELEAGKQRVEDALSAQEMYFKVLHDGTTQSIKDQIASLKLRQAAEQDALSAQVAAAKAAREGTPILGALGVALSGLPKHIQDNKEAIQQDQFQIDALTKALGTNAVAANDAKAALEKQTEAAKKQTEDQKQVIRATSDAIKQTQDQAAKDEAAILQRAADQRIAIAQRAAAAEQDAYTNLQRSLAEDRIKLGQDQADARLNFQRTEAQSAESHFKALLKIRKDAEADEFELQLNRDFAGIAKLRRDTEKRLDEEDVRYGEERKQRLTALKNQFGDQQKAFIREREQRNRQYQQQLTDLRTSKERELKLNNDAATLDLQRLHARLTAELAMRQDAYSVALQLEANYLARLKALVGGQSLPTTQINATQPHEQVHPGTGGYASGGYPPVGKWSSVNERRGQRESFTAGGQSIMLPGGMGLFKPLRSGRVDSGGGNISIPINLSVSGSTWAEMRKRVHADLDTKLSEAFEALTA